MLSLMYFIVLGCLLVLVMSKIMFINYNFIFLKHVYIKKWVPTPSCNNLFSKINAFWNYNYLISEIFDVLDMVSKCNGPDHHDGFKKGLGMGKQTGEHPIPGYLYVCVFFYPPPFIRLVSIWICFIWISQHFHQPILPNSNLLLILFSCSFHNFFFLN